MRAAQKTGSKLQRLTELFAGKAYLLIGMQDTPDPDSLAAAVALRRLAKGFGNAQCSIACGGTVGRAENRALVEYLGLNCDPTPRSIMENTISSRWLIRNRRRGTTRSPRRLSRTS